MYCPKCAAPNNDDARFCRACGEDLKVIAQAMSKSLPVVIGSKFDRFLETKHHRNYRDGILNGISGVCLFVLAVWHLISGAGIWGFYGVMLLASFVTLGIGVWDILIYRRNRPLIAKRSEGLSDSRTRELSTGQLQVPAPPSVTDSTTKLLDPGAKGMKD